MEQNKKPNYLQSVLNQIQTQWLTFCKKYQYNPDLGYLIPDDHKIVNFDIQIIKPYLEKLPQLNETGEIIQITQKFPQIPLIYPLNFQDMTILHDTTAMIIQSYFMQKIKTTKNQDIKIPANLAYPHYIATQFLKCSPGNITVYQFNWSMKDNKHITDPENVLYEDIQLKWYFTKEKTQQSIFFVLNLLGSYYLWKIVKNVYFINYLIKNTPWFEDQIIRRFQHSVELWQKLTQENSKLVAMIDVYFYKVLRPYISGFSDIYFEKVNQRLTAERGNAGFDPAFQMFDQLLGIDYTQINAGFDSFRKQMRKVMPQLYCQSILAIKQIAGIRQPCKQSQYLVQEYNKLVQAEIKFATLHNEFIIKYIQKFRPGVQNIPPVCYALKKAKSLQFNLLKFEGQKEDQN